MNEIIKDYFSAFAKKDLKKLAELYDENVVLWEWGTNIFMGKEQVLAANLQLFESVEELKVLIHSHAPADLEKSFTELMIFLDKQMISVVDVITTHNGKITTITAYRGF